MSTDMISNQVSADVKSASVASSVSAKPAGDRQMPAAEGGNALPPEPAADAVDSKQLQKVVAQLNESFQQIQRDLQFSIDEDSGRSVVRVVNSKTEELVRQIPSEEVLRISQNIEEQLASVTGLLFETSA